MKLRMLAAAAILSATFAAPAFAAGADINVSLQAPVAAKTKVVAGGAVFTCAYANCIAQDAPSRALTAATCKAVVKEVGRVAAYGSERKTLAADDLARCNGDAGPLVQAAN